MTPDQFFEELDKLFGTDDGYENHLKRIKELKEQEDECVEFKKNLDEIVVSLKEFREKAPIVVPLEEHEQKIAELETDLEDEKEEHENTEYDLEKLRESLEPLDEMMDKIKDVTDYEHVVDYVNGLHQKNIELEEKFENEQSTNKMLNDAIIDYTEMLDELHTYLSNFDGDVLEVFTHIVKGPSEEEKSTEIEEYMKCHPGKTFEEAIISDFGDQSHQAKKYGFGVFKKSTD